MTYSDRNKLIEYENRLEREYQRELEREDAEEDECPDLTICERHSCKGCWRWIQHEHA